MIEQRNIICIASNWFQDPTSKHHVMRILSRRNHIVWVNHHGSRRPRLSSADAGAIAVRLRQVIEGPRHVTDAITVVTPLVIPLPGNAAAAVLNRRLLTRQIRNVLRDLPRRPVQLWSFAPDVDYLCGQFDEECVVYYCVDEFSEFSGYDRNAILAAEQRLADRTDLIITTSQALYESKRSLNRHVELVTHGVDYDHFAGALSDDVSMPDDLAGLPKPILGFWGLIHDWVDFELLATLARARPAWSIVLIGAVAVDRGTLSRLPNVHCLGRRAYADLPAYAHGFDVGLIPFRLNDLTRAVNPIKLREYLAAGLPVVSTALPEVRRYADWVHVAENPDQFVAACDTAVRQANPRKAAARRAAMRSETWESKVTEVARHLSRLQADATTRSPLRIASGQNRDRERAALEPEPDVA
ncbi:MAG: glycosyltransferase [Phycisphaerae bacterium]